MQSLLLRLFGNLQLFYLMHLIVFYLSQSYDPVTAQLQSLLLRQLLNVQLFCLMHLIDLNTWLFFTHPELVQLQLLLLGQLVNLQLFSSAGR